MYFTYTCISTLCILYLFNCYLYMICCIYLSQKFSESSWDSHDNLCVSQTKGSSNPPFGKPNIPHPPQEIADLITVRAYI